PTNRWPSRKARSSQFEAVAGDGAASFVIEKPAGTDGAGAAPAPPAETRTASTTAAPAVADASAVGMGDIGLGNGRVGDMADSLDAVDCRSGPPAQRAADAGSWAQTYARSWRAVLS